LETISIAWPQTMVLLISINLQVARFTDVSHMYLAYF
jgi:hypothetical protein